MSHKSKTVSNGCTPSPDIPNLEHGFDDGRTERDINYDWLEHDGLYAKDHTVVLPDEPIERYGEIEFQIVGTDPSGDRCGHILDVYHTGNCRDGAEYRYVTCGNRSCSYCFRGWIDRHTDRIIERMEDYRALVKDLNYHRRSDGMYSDGLVTRLCVPDSAVPSPLGNPYHMTVYPPSDWAKDMLFRRGVDGLKYIRSRTNTLLREHGFRGGITVFHGYGVTDEYKQLYLEETGHIDCRGIWVWLRERGFPKGSVKVDPHFHIIGWGMLTSSDMFYEETKLKRGLFAGSGWTYTKHNTLDKRTLMEYTLRYMLSHTVIAYADHTDHNATVCDSVSWVGEIRDLRREIEYEWGYLTNDLGDFYYFLNKDYWERYEYYSPLAKNNLVDLPTMARTGVLADALERCKETVLRFLKNDTDIGWQMYQVGWSKRTLYLDHDRLRWYRITREQPPPKNVVKCVKRDDING